MIPTLDQLDQYNVNRPNQVEGIKWSLYDSLAYATTGQAQLQFFQTPQGQNSKTAADTNMVSAGQLPAPQAFLITGISLLFIPGVNPSVFGAAAASEFANDTFQFYTKPAWLQLYIGSKDYINEAPLMRFPPTNGMSGFAAISDTSTAGASEQTQMNYATAAGDPYEVSPPLLLTANQNFKVTLNWPTLVPFTTAARVYCHLSGYLYRNSQ